MIKPKNHFLVDQELCHQVQISIMEKGLQFSDYNKIYANIQISVTLSHWNNPRSLREKN